MNYGRTLSNSHLCNMKINLLAFGIAKDIVGSQKSAMEVQSGMTSNQLMTLLSETYPQMAETNAMRLAVNEEYVQEVVILQDGDEVALIPPVSGG